MQQFYVTERNHTIHVAETLDELAVASGCAVGDVMMVGLIEADSMVEAGHKATRDDLEFEMVLV